LDLFKLEIAPFDLPSPINPTLEPYMKCIGLPVAEIWPFAYLGAYGTPFWEKGRS